MKKFCKTSSATDYTYDGNGNLNLDNNKKISSINYNYLNLPGVITVAGKGTITYVYDASGNKLSKITVDNTVSPSKTTTTLYMFGNYVNDTLQFLPQEEGRIRYNQDSARFVYDYFLKDHLGNVRAVLTEDQKTDAYPAATMELSDSTANSTFYSNIATTRNTLPNGYPTDNSYSNPNQYAAKVNGGGNKIGPAIVLKVMAGDKFNVRVSDWYNKGGNNPTTPYNPVSDLITALTNNIGGISSKATITQLSSSGVLNSGAASFYRTHNSADSINKPKAFLNWVLFDEQFNYVAGSSGFEQVGGNNTSIVNIHQFSNLPITKNGYLYVYVSNETPNIDVYFDNLQVTHIRGPLTQDQSYSPWGLVLQGISSNAVGFGSQNNKLKFNGKEEQRQEFSDGSGLEWLDYGARMYDNQIGRWSVPDPKTEKFISLSQYDYVGGNPIKRFDPDGMDWYRDQSKNLEFDPNVHGQKDLKDGQTYVAATYQEKNKKGKITADYRKDGSIMFKKQKDAYNRMYNNSKANGNREEYGVITKRGVLVTPDYKNNAGEGSPLKYGYTFKDGNLVDAVTNSEIPTVATIHTHLALADPEPSFADQEIHDFNTPNKPYLTIGNDGNIYGNYGTWPIGKDGKYHPSQINTSNINFQHYGINVNSILNGLDLEGFLEEYMKKVLQK